MGSEIHCYISLQTVNYVCLCICELSLAEHFITAVKLHKMWFPLNYSVISQCTEFYLESIIAQYIKKW